MDRPLTNKMQTGCLLLVLLFSQSILAQAKTVEKAKKISPPRLSAQSKSQSVPPAEWVWVPTWSPDGKSIAVNWPAPKKVALEAVSVPAKNSPPGPVFIETPPTIRPQKPKPRRFAFIDNIGERRTILLNASNFERLPVNIQALLMSVAWSPNGKMLAGITLTGQSAIFDTSSGKVIMAISAATTGAYPDMSWSPDSQLIACANRESTAVYNVTNKTKQFVFPDLKGGGDCSVAWSQQGDLVAACGAQKENSTTDAVRICNGRTGKLVFSSTSKEGIRMADWSKDKNWFAYSDKSIHILSAKTFKEELVLKPKGQNNLAQFQWASSGSKIAYCGSDGILHIYDMGSKKEISTIPSEKTGAISFVWSPDSTLLAINDHNTLAICRASDGKYLGSKDFADTPITTWSADGKALALSGFSAECVYWVPLNLKDDAVAIEAGSKGNPWQGQKEPENLEDCFAELDSTLSPLYREQIKSCSEKDLCLYTGGPSLGMQLRNTWGLRRQNALTDYFKSMGITNGASMSAIIIEAYWRRLNNKPLEIDELARRYRFR